MNWQEIKQSAEAYRARQVAVGAQREKELEKEFQIRAEEQERQWQEEIQQAQEILEKLGVREALETVRDEVWSEGEIGEVAGKKEIGLLLLSDPYPTIVVEKKDRRLSIRLREEQTSLSVLVIPKKDDAVGSIGSDGREKRVVVKDENAFSIKHSYRQSPEIMKVTIRSYGLERGLREVSRYDRIPVKQSYIGPASEDAVEHFHNVLLAHLESRISEESLPAVIRLWSASLVDQLPPTLRQTGRVEERELREWGHQVRGTSRAVVLFDRLLHRA